MQLARLGRRHSTVPDGVGPTAIRSLAAEVEAMDVYRLRWLWLVLPLALAAGAAEPTWLAEALSAPDAAARRQLLAAHRAEVTVALGRQLAMQAGDRAAAADALARLDLAADLAELLKAGGLAGYVAMQRGWVLAARAEWPAAATAFEQGHRQLQWADATAACAAWRAWCGRRAGDQPAVDTWLPRTKGQPAALYEAVRAASGRDEVLLGWAEYHRGRVEEDQQRWPASEAAYLAAAQRFEQAGAARPLAAALDRGGLVCVYQSKLPEAERLYQRSLAAAEQAADSYAVGRAWLGFAEIANDRANLERVLDCAGQAAPHFERAGANVDVARCYWLRAVARQNSGRHDLVEAELQQAETWYRRDQSRGGLADCQFIRGFNWLLLGDRARAVAALEEAGRTYHQTGNYLGEGNVKLKMAHACRAVGQYERAERLAREALTTYRSLRERPGEANAMRALAVLANQRGDNVAAEQLYREAMAIYEAIGDRLGQAAAQGALGSLMLRRQGNLEQTVRTLLDSLDLYQQIGDQHGAASACLKLAELLAANREAKLARNALLRALALAQASGSRSALADTYFHLGTFCEALEPPQLAAAAEFYRLALDVVEQMRVRAGGQEAQQGLRREYVRYYDALTRVLLKLGQVAGAFAICEEAHARTLLDLVVDAGIDLNAGLSTEVRREEEQRANRLTAATLQVGRLLALPDAKDDDIQKAKAQLAAAREAADQFREELCLVHPDLGRKRSAEVIGTPQLQNVLPADTGLLEYHVGERETYAFLVTNQGSVQVRAATIALTQSAVTERVARLREACSSPRLRYRQLAKEAADTFLAPLLANLPEGIKRLVIVPDQALFELPFQALPLGDTLLWERCALVYACSATLLKQARALPPTTAQGLLVFANPKFGPLVRSPELERGTPPVELPGTAAEAQVLGDLFGTTAAIYQGAEAQEEVAKTRMADYRYVHFATHGVLDSASPLYSAVLLSEPRAGSREDGQLEARELMELRLKADLVVLSACETGRGKVQPGEGLLGLTWALTAAGARSQVVSQWKVSDEASQQFMGLFYRRLREGADKATALREAALAMRGRSEHPFTWAPFVLIGSW